MALTGLWLSIFPFFLLSYISKYLGRFDFFFFILPIYFGTVDSLSDSEFLLSFVICIATVWRWLSLSLHIFPRFSYFFFLSCTLLLEVIGGDEKTPQY